MAAFAAGFYAAGQNMAKAVLSLTYEEASQGETPNGTWLNWQAIRSGNVIGRAIELAGIDIAPEVLRSALDVRLPDENINQVSASCVVTLRLQRGAYEPGTARVLLERVCEAYRAYVLEHDLVSPKALALADMSSMDGVQQSAYVRMMAERAQTYLRQREEQMGAFVTEDGQSFTQMQALLADFLKELSAFDACIQVSGTPGERQRMMERARRAEADAAAAIRHYEREAEIYRSVLLDYGGVYPEVWAPIGGGQGEVVLRRAADGADHFAALVQERLAQAEEARREQAVNQALLNRLAEEPSPALETDAWAEELRMRLCSIVEQIGMFDRLCVAERMGDVIRYEIREPSWAERLHLK